MLDVCIFPRFFLRQNDTKTLLIGNKKLVDIQINHRRNFPLLSSYFQIFLGNLDLWVIYFHVHQGSQFGS